MQRPPYARASGVARRALHCSEIAILCAACEIRHPASDGPAFRRLLLGGRGAELQASSISAFGNIAQAGRAAASHPGLPVELSRVVVDRLDHFSRELPRQHRTAPIFAVKMHNASSGAAPAGAASSAALSAADRAYALDAAKLEAARHSKPWLTE